MGQHDNLYPLLCQARKGKSERNEESLVSCVKISMVVWWDEHSKTDGILLWVARLTLLGHKPYVDLWQCLS
jgi:hypothetical protein